MTRRGALPTRREIGVVMLLVVAGVLLRLVFPGADAVHPRWYGWMTDEGRWTELAREWALFGSPELDSPVSRIHLLMAPLFQGVVALAFEIRGVGLEVARIPARVTGIALLLIAVVGLRRALCSWAWVAMTGLVAFHPELVYFSRVAIPEMPALLAGFGAFLLLVRPEASRWSDAGAGLLTATAVGFKGTTLLYVPAFALGILILGRPVDHRSPLDRLVAWGAGVILPGVLVLGGVILAGTGLPGAGGTVEAILRFVDFTGFYDMSTTFLLGGSTDDVNLLLAVLCALSVMVMLRDPPDSAARRIYRGGWAWAMAWLLPLMVLEYFPPRYVVHLHLALILTLSGAIALVWDPRGRPPAQTWASWSWGRRVSAASVVALPLAVVGVPVLLGVVDTFGPRLDRMRIVAPLLVALSAGLGIAGARRSLDWIFGPVFVVLPLAAAVVWRGIEGPGSEMYWVVDAGSTLLPWALAWLGGLAVAGLVGRSRRDASAWMALGAGAVAYVAALVVLWTGIRHVPALARPSYELRGLSEALSQRYPPEELIGVAKLTGAFLDTPFRYREVAVTDSLPGVVVTTNLSPYLPTDSVVGLGYRIVSEFSIPVFRFRGDPRRPTEQPLFEEGVIPVEVLERGSDSPPASRPEGIPPGY